MGGALTRMSGRQTVASGPTATAHRYWRIYIGGDSAGAGSLVVSASEVEMRESVGGADATGSGTAAADSTFSGFSAAGAFANDGTATEWASAGTAYPHWLSYDFGVGITKAIVEVAIQTRSGLTSTQGPGAFKIQSSDDNSAWADEWWVVYPGGANGHGYVDGSLKTFTKPVVSQSPTASRHRYWRLGITGSNGAGFVGAANVEMRTLSSSVDETEGGTASSTSNFGTLVPANAFTGMNPGDTLEWASNNAGFPEYLKYDFGAARPVFVQELFYKPRVGLESSQSPTGFTIEYSDDNSSWTTVRTVTGITGWTSAGKTYSVP